MSMVYKNNEDLILATGRVIAALKELSTKGIAVVSIEFTSLQPVIAVQHCPGNRRLTSVVFARIQDVAGVKFIRKISHIHNCAVIWEEEEV